jgi:glutamyl endopeptidase
MKQASFAFKGWVAAIALTAPIPAFSQSNHDAVSSDGSVVATEAAAPRSPSRPSFGASAITAEALSAEGVTVGAESAARLSRLMTLRDPAETGKEVVIGWDTREQLYTSLYPARARVLITFSAGRCSGTMIGPDTVATAGHCVHSGGSAGAWYPVASYRIYPGRNGAASPYGVCTARRTHSVIGWTVNGSEEYDYAAIKLNCTVGNTVGWFGLTTAAPTGFPSGIAGYPGDKPLTQWTSSDIVRAISARQVFYLNDTIGGQSGSGVWYDRDGPYIIGIHAYGTHGTGNHALYNHGTRIVSPVFNNLISWSTAAP